MGSRLKLSASTQTCEHLYRSIQLSRLVQSAFCTFTGIDKLPFLWYSILTLTVDIFEIPLWHNVCQNPAKKVLLVTSEILSLMLADKLHFFVPCLRYSHGFISRCFVWLFNLFPREFNSHSLMLHWMTYSQQLSVHL